jgi:CDP-diacylglycerol--serine O-phosphatidyltransferase
MRKQVPNVFTLLNLVFGCIAIVVILQPGLMLSVDENGQQTIEIPQKIFWASICIGLAAVVDFLDGLIARALKASSEMGKQLDSLADVVSFGVAPGMIIFEFLRRSYATQPNGLDVSILWLLPAFIIPCAGAYRLARFNIDPTQAHYFKGVPIPAIGLCIASFPLIYWFSNTIWMIELMVNKWFLYSVVLLLSYLMVSSIPIMELKFKKLSFNAIWPFLFILVVAIISAYFLGWMAVPVSFIAYVVLSLLLKQRIIS